MGSRNNFIRYADGDGHDTVWGITANDTLNILAEQSVTSLIISGNDIRFTVGEGSILLKNAKGKPLHITYGESGTSGGSSGGGNGGSSGSDGSSGGNSSGSNGYRIGIYRRKETSSSTTNPANSYGTSTSTTHAANRYFYTGGDLVISTCKADEKIIFATDYTGAIYDGAGNFLFGSPTDVLAVQNIADKIIDIRDGAGVVEIRLVGLKLQSSVGVAQCRLEIADLAIRPRPSVVSTRVILTQLNRTPVIGYSVLPTLEPPQGYRTIQIRPRKLIVNRQRLVVIVNRRPAVAKTVVVDVPAIHEHELIIGIKLGGLIEQIQHRIVVAALFERQRLQNNFIGSGIRVPNFGGALQVGFGFFILAQRTVCLAAILEGFGVIGLKLYGFIVIGYRLAHLIQPRLCRPAIVPRQEIIGIKLYRLAEVLRRPLMVALIAILIALAQFQVRQEDFILADNFSGNGFFFRRRLCLQYE